MAVYGPRVPRKVKALADAKGLDILSFERRDGRMDFDFYPAPWSAEPTPTKVGTATGVTAAVHFLTQYNPEVGA